MANEIIIRENYTLTNAQLNKEFEKIRTALNTAVKQANVIGKALKTIKDRELWKDDFKSFEESAEVFGIKKAQAYNLIKGFEIYDKFKLEDFSNTQCVEIAKLDKAEGEKGVRSAIESGLIKQTMTTKEIREAIDNYLHPEKAAELEAKEAEAEAEAEAIEADTDDDFDLALGFYYNKEAKRWEMVDYLEKYTIKDIEAMAELLKTLVK